MPIAKVSKEEIVTIALKYFLNEGIQAVTLKHLSDTMRISTKTVYKHFTDKKELLKSCLTMHYADFFKELSQLRVSGENELEVLLNIIHRTVALEFEVNPLFYAELNKYYPQLQTEVSQVQKKIFGDISNSIEEGKKNGIFLPEISQEVFWIAFVQLYAGITRDHLYNKLDLSGPELIQNTVLIYVRGICTLKGLLLLEHYNNQNSN